jgi:ABC-type molybdate transport system substrate-binding protein
MSMQIRNATTAAAIAAVLAALTPTPGVAGEAIETRVFSSAAPRGILREITPVFERTTGHRLVIEFAFAADLKRRIEAGNPFDVAILPPDMADDLMRRDKLAAGSQVDLSRTGMGVAARSRAPKLDIGTVHAFRHALLAAPHSDGSHLFDLEQVSFLDCKRLAMAPNIQSPPNWRTAPTQRKPCSHRLIPVPSHR